MTDAKVLDWLFCRRISVVSSRFKMYVCDDCYDKQQAEKKEWIKSGKWKKYELV